MIGSGIQPLQNLSVLQKIGDEGKMEWAHFHINKGFIGNDLPHDLAFSLYFFVMDLLYI